MSPIQGAKSTPSPTSSASRSVNPKEKPPSSKEEEHGVDRELKAASRNDEVAGDEVNELQHELDDVDEGLLGVIGAICGIHWKLTCGVGVDSIVGGLALSADEPCMYRGVCSGVCKSTSLCSKDASASMAASRGSTSDAGSAVLLSGDTQGSRACRGVCSGVCKPAPSRSKDARASIVASRGSASEVGSVVLHESALRERVFVTGSAGSVHQRFKQRTRPC